MTDDYRVKPRSNAQVIEIAKKSRCGFVAADQKRVDVFCCLRRPRIWTVLGEKDLKFAVRPDAEMGPSDGLTEFKRDTVFIDLKQSVAEKARFGDGEARETSIHELGHAVLGHDRGVPMARRALGNTTPKWMLESESAEHQARVFAVAFLIKDSVAQTLSSADEISAQFGVSLESASIYFDQMAKERKRAQDAEEMQRKADEFRASVAPKKHELHFLQELCPSCKLQKLFPVGSKYMCQNCNFIWDPFQDGDSVT